MASAQRCSPRLPAIALREPEAGRDRYVELELRGADADATIPGMGAHLEGCPACHEDHRSLRALVAAESSSA